MTTLLEIEAAIKQLPSGDVRQLSVWLQEYLDQMWDRQIEADLVSGKLDKLIAKAEAYMAAKSVKISWWKIEKIYNWRAVNRKYMELQERKLKAPLLLARGWKLWIGFNLPVLNIS